MAMRTVNILEEQPQLSELLRFISAGDEVVIVEGDRLLAQLIPAPSAKRKRVPGLNRDAIWTSSDFDEPLPDKYWAGSP